jgi:hypothetical protein
MVFQALSSSCTNQGECYPSNWWLSLALVIFLSVTCIFFSITDCIILEDTLYYGVALPGRLFLLNLSHRERRRLNAVHRVKLEHRRLEWVDFLRAIITAIMFLAFAFGDTGIQNCFFPHADLNAKQGLKNTPLVAAVISGFLLMLCQTKRKPIDLLRRSIHAGGYDSDSSSEDNIADYQKLDIESVGFPKPSIGDMLQTREHRILVHDELFHRARDDLLITRRAPDENEMRRVHSESNLVVPRIYMGTDMV